MLSLEIFLLIRNNVQLDVGVVDSRVLVITFMEVVVLSLGQGSHTSSN